MFCQMQDFPYAFKPHLEQFSVPQTANILQEKSTSLKLEQMF